jgi:pre-mRNA-splicing helicase BRR2
MVDPDLERKEAEIGEEGGVAVLFDEEDRDDEDDEGFEIREESDEEEEEEQGDGDIVIDGEAREEEHVIGGESSRTVEARKDIVSPHYIDAF